MQYVPHFGDTISGTSTTSESRPEDRPTYRTPANRPPVDKKMPNPE